MPRGRVTSCKRNRTPQPPAPLPVPKGTPCFACIGWKAGVHAGYDDKEKEIRICDVLCESRKRLDLACRWFLPSKIFYCEVVPATMYATACVHRHRNRWEGCVHCKTGKALALLL